MSHPTMATVRSGDNLEGMYTTAVPRVRDEPAAYGPHEIDGDPFPAARVLEDLREASDLDVPRILARYAALRSWQLRAASAEPELVRHATETARGYLAVTGDWPEAPLLARVVDGDPAMTAVQAAATAAADVGHCEGAYALLHTGYLAARHRRALRPAARFAGRIAALLQVEELDGADLWARRADRLQRRADGG